MKQFKTESKKLLDLMINSIYTNREIFLRELISNASDALDKLEFKSLTDPDVKLGADPLAIRVAFDTEARTITVSDNGIGMTEAELDKNLGTIAHSGSERFKQEAEGEQAGAVDIIGQFGVGFYSSFMVASNVRVVSRAFGADAAYVWESDGMRGYTVSPAAEGERSGADDHGTDVILYLREATEDCDTDELLMEYTLKALIRRYSNYVRHPVQMMIEKTRQLPKPDDAGDDYKPQYEQYEELETINSMTPIWRKRESEVSQEDYNEFYKMTFHDWHDPARVFSTHAEGTISYDALLFIPSERPMDLYSKDYEKGLALYSSNVLIQEKCSELVPDHFNFVRGVVASPDIALNISRETMQHNSQLRIIARDVDRKITRELEKMRDEEREEYEKFFENFGRGIKFGIYNSYGQRKDLAEFMIFWSAKEEKMVTFYEYCKAMPQDQDKIYYAVGESRTRLAQMPVVRSAISHGYDVLLCTTDIDEFMFQAMQSYHQPAISGDSERKGTDERDVEFANISAADLDFATDEEKERAEKAQEDYDGLLDVLTTRLEGKVSEVRFSAKLGEAPAVVTAAGPVSLEMERILQNNPQAEYVPTATRVLELNADHPVLEKLVAAHEAGDGDRLGLYANLLYDQALLVAGLPIEDPIAFAKNVCELM